MTKPSRHPYTSPQRLFKVKNAKELKRDIRVNPGEDVIQHNTESASDPFQLAAGKWFDDIQKAEREEIRRR